MRCPVVEEEGVRPSRWFISLLLCSRECFDTVGWVTGWTCDQRETCTTYF